MGITLQKLRSWNALYVASSQIVLDFSKLDKLLILSSNAGQEDISQSSSDISVILFRYTTPLVQRFRIRS